MPGQSLHIRKIEKNDKVLVFGKLFEKSEVGYKNGALYSKTTSSRKIIGEQLKCTINKNVKSIKIELDSGFPISTIDVVGTSSLTRLKGTYNTTGNFTKGFGDVIKSVLNSVQNVDGLIIDFDDDAESKIEKKNKRTVLRLSSFDYNYINGLFNTEKKASSDNSLYVSAKYLSSKIKNFPEPSGKKGKEISAAFKSQIFEEVLNGLDQSELEKLLFQIYEKYFSELQNKIELFKKTDTRKIQYVLEQFDEYFINFPNNEKKWQELFEKHYRVINPNYKYIIREIDTIFECLDLEASSRPVDFIGVDIYNNLELVELKTPGAAIISTKKDRNNYCLVHNCTKACTQLEKYLASLEGNKSNVEKLVREKVAEKYGVKAKEINIAISKPKAKLIMGEIKPLLSKPSRHSDFQLQRHSFKNIEIVTFDEIYSSLMEIKIELSKKLKRK